MIQHIKRSLLGGRWDQNARDLSLFQCVDKKFGSLKTTQCAISEPTLVESYVHLSRIFSVY